MSDNKPSVPSNGETQGLKIKITLELSNLHAPGIVEFLRALPARGETAFIRGLIYQWMSKYQGSEDFSLRLLSVLNGPGGRWMYMLPNQVAQASAAVASTHRQTARKPPKTTGSTTHAAQPRDMRAIAEEPVAAAFPIVRASAELGNRASIPADASRATMTDVASRGSSTVASSQQPSATLATTSDSESEGELNPFVDFF